MATISSHSAVCDGYDVQCRLGDGRTQVFHFADRPADVQSAVDQAEASLLAAEAALAAATEPLVIEEQ